MNSLTRSRLRTSFLMLACAMGLTPTIACAQLLDLDPPEAPEPGDGWHAVSLAGDLDRRAAQLDGAPAAYRRVAAAVLRAAERGGEDGAPMILTAMTMARHADAFDAVVRAHEAEGPAGAVRVRLVAASLRGLAPSIDDASARAESVGSSVPVLGIVPRETGVRGRRPEDELAERLRTALAPLTADAAPAGLYGWWPDGLSSATDPAAAIERALTLASTTPGAETAGDLAAALGVDQSSDAAPSGPLGAVLAGLRSGLDHPAYRGRAAEVGSGIERCLAFVTGPPEWVDESDVATVRVALTAGAASMQEEGAHGRGALVIAAAASWCEVARLLASDSAAVNGGNRVAIREAREAAAALAPQIVESPARLAERLGALETALGVLARAAEIEEEVGEAEMLVRQVRPAFWSLETDLRLARARLFARLPRIAAADRPGTDPAVISLLRAKDRAVETLVGLRTLSDIVGEDHTGKSTRPRAQALADDYAAVGERLLELGELTRDDDDLGAQREAGAALESLARGLRALGRIPGDEREGDADARDLTESVFGDDLAATLLGRKAALRDAWLAAWARGNTREAERLVVRMEELGDLLEEAELCWWATNRGEMANAWPGFELSESAMTAAVRGWRQSVRQRGRAAAAGRSIDNESPRERFAAGAVIGACARSAAGGSSFRDEAVVRTQMDVVLELAVGPPLPGVWGMDARRDVALLCWSLEEIGSNARSPAGVADPDRSPRVVFGETASRHAVRAAAALVGW